MQGWETLALFLRANHTRWLLPQGRKALSSGEAQDAEIPSHPLRGSPEVNNGGEPGEPGLLPGEFLRGTSGFGPGSGHGVAAARARGLLLYCTPGTLTYAARGRAGPQGIQESAGTRCSGHGAQWPISRASEHNGSIILGCAQRLSEPHGSCAQDGHGQVASPVTPGSRTGPACPPLLAQEWLKGLWDPPGRIRSGLPH